MKGKVVEWIEPALELTNGGVCEHGKEPSGSIQYEEFPDRLRNS
jgi:hypothetical protein